MFNNQKVRILWLEDVDSTMSEAQRHVHEAKPLWIAARHQHQGRGTKGRAWVDSPDNLKTTLLLEPNRAMSDWPQASLVAALALHDAIADQLGSAEALALKWPNDVLLNGRKIAGILLETISSTPQPCLAIGMGVNLATHPPPETLRRGGWPVTDILTETEIKLEPRAFLERLSVQMQNLISLWEREGFAQIQPLWMANAYGLGDEVVLQVGHARHAGHFEGIDLRGFFSLQSEGLVQTFPSADVIWPSK